MAINSVGGPRPQTIQPDRNVQQTRQAETSAPVDEAQRARSAQADVPSVPEPQQTREGDVSGGSTSRQGMRDLETQTREAQAQGTYQTHRTAAPALEDVRGDTTLRRGQQGESVAEVQHRLNSAGYACGADGQFGPRTERAVQQFQGDQGLPTTGYVDRATLDRLSQPAGADAGRTDPVSGTDRASSTQRTSGTEGTGGTGESRRTMDQWRQDVDPASVHNIEPGSPEAPRTRAGGVRIGELRDDNSRSSHDTIAQIGYPREMTREQVSRDLFGTDTPPDGTIITPRRHDPSETSARRWDVSLSDEGNRRLNQRAFDAIWVPRSGLENTFSPGVQRALDEHRVPPGSREVRPGIHLCEDRGHTIRVDTRNGGYRHEVWTPLETNERAILDRGIGGQASRDPHYAHLQAEANRQYNFLMRHRLEEGETVGQAHAATLAQLNEESRQMIGAWGQAMASGTFGSRAPGTALEQGAAALDAARNPYEQIMTARQQAQRDDD